MYTTVFRRLTYNKVVLLKTQEGNEKGGHLDGSRNLESLLAIITFALHALCPVTEGMCESDRSAYTLLPVPFPEVEPPLFWPGSI